MAAVLSSDMDKTAQVVTLIDEARRGETAPAGEAGVEPEIEPGEDLAPTPSAMMSLIPVGEAILRR